MESLTIPATRPNKVPKGCVAICEWFDFGYERDRIKVWQPGSFYPTFYTPPGEPRGRYPVALVTPEQPVDGSAISNYAFTSYIFRIEDGYLERNPKNPLMLFGRRVRRPRRLAAIA